jgi:hypothetical protein
MIESLLSVVEQGIAAGGDLNKPWELLEEIAVILAHLHFLRRALFVVSGAVAADAFLYPFADALKLTHFGHGAPIVDNYIF